MPPAAPHPRHRSTPRSPRRTWAAVIPIIAAAFLLLAQQRGWITPTPPTRPTAPTTTHSVPPAAPPAAATGAGSIAAAFRNHQSDVWVEASGTVIKLLPDDRDAVPHQKFLVRIDDTDTLTVLIAHNLDAAQRVPAREGDSLRFRGEYEWTEKGGTIHFTHAPELKRTQPGGWIELDGTRYE